MCSVHYFFSNTNKINKYTNERFKLINKNWKKMNIPTDTSIPCLLRKNVLMVVLP